jgi:2-C-methyl-D-erythritol 4-phosphate cytidylyltransferase
VLCWSVEALAGAGIDRIVIVTSPDRLAEVAVEPWLPDAVVAVVAGGERRQQSVAAGVAALADPLTPPAPTRAGRATRRRTAGAAADGKDATRHQDPILLVHDAARPLASPDLVRAVAEAAARHGAAIPVVPITETLKRLDGDRVGVTVDRSGVVAPRRRKVSAEVSWSGPTPNTLRTAPRPGRTKRRCWRPVESRSMQFAAKPPTSK